MNKHTRFKETIALLPHKIRKPLLAYQIKDAFYSRTTVKGFFKEGNVPMVNVDFSMRNNDLMVQQTPFNKTTLEGSFANYLGAGKAAEIVKKKHVKVLITALETNQDAFHIQADSLLITSRPETGPRILTKAIIKGNSGAISDWLKNDEFYFEEGQVDLLATIEGPLNNINELIITSNAHLLLTDFFVIYRPSNTRFPFDHLSLTKQAGAAQFTVLNTTVTEGHTVKFDGGLTNISALLLKMLNQQTSSEIAIESGKLSWSDFINLFGEHGHLRRKSPKTDAEKKKSMKETLRGIQHNFQPRLRINVDTLEYFDLLAINNFQTGLHFEDEHILSLIHI